MITKAITILLQHNYQVFLPVGHSQRVFVIDTSKGLRLCVLVPAYKTDRDPIVRLVSGRGRAACMSQLANFHIIAAIDESTDRLWLIPYEDLPLAKSIRLGNKCSCYLVTKQEGKDSKLGLMRENITKEDVAKHFSNTITKTTVGETSEDILKLLQ